MFVDVFPPAVWQTIENATPVLRRLAISVVDYAPRGFANAPALWTERFCMAIADFAAAGHALDRDRSRHAILWAHELLSGERCTQNDRIIRRLRNRYRRRTLECERLLGLAAQYYLAGEIVKAAHAAVYAAGLHVRVAGGDWSSANAMLASVAHVGGGDAAVA